MGHIFDIFLTTWRFHTLLKPSQPVTGLLYPNCVGAGNLYSTTRITSLLFWWHELMLICWCWCFDLSGLTLKSDKNWVQKLVKSEATSDFDMIMILLKISSNHSFWGPETTFHKFNHYWKNINQLITLSITTIEQIYVQEIHPNIPWSNVFLPKWIYSLNSLNTPTTKWKKLDSSNIKMNMSCIKNFNSLSIKIIKIGQCCTLTNAKVIPLPYKSWQWPVMTLQLTLLTSITWMPIVNNRHGSTDNHCVACLCWPLTWWQLRLKLNKISSNVGIILTLDVLPCNNWL